MGRNSREAAANAAVMILKACYPGSPIAKEEKAVAHMVCTTCDSASPEDAAVFLRTLQSEMSRGLAVDPGSGKTIRREASGWLKANGDKMAKAMQEGAVSRRDLFL